MLIIRREPAPILQNCGGRKLSRWRMARHIRAVISNNKEKTERGHGAMGAERDSEKPLPDGKGLLVTLLSG